MDGAYHTESILLSHDFLRAPPLPTPWTASQCTTSIQDTVVNGEGRASSCACCGTLAHHRLELLRCLLDQKAQEQLWPRRDPPILQLRRDLLLRHCEKVSQVGGVREPAQGSDRSNHEHREGAPMVLAFR